MKSAILVLVTAAVFAAGGFALVVSGSSEPEPTLSSSDASEPTSSSSVSPTSLDDVDVEVAIASVDATTPVVEPVLQVDVAQAPAGNPESNCVATLDGLEVLPSSGGAGSGTIGDGGSTSYCLDVVTSGFVTISVVSDADTVLDLVGGGVDRSNDDTNGVNPEISGFFDAGAYEVVVRGFDAEQAAEFTIDVQPVASPAVQNCFDAVGNVAVLESSYGFVDGSLDAGGSASYCLSVAESASVTVSVSSEIDTVLNIVGNDFSVSDDDTNGLNPEVSEFFEAGVYEIIVSGYDGQAGEIVVEVFE